MNNQVIKYACIGGLLISQSALSATAILEDFSGSISLQKFDDMERNIELDTDAQNLIVKAASSSYSKKARSNSLVLDDSDITMLQADLTVTELTLGNSDTQHALLRVAGTFYNADSAAATTSLGDVFADLTLGDRGNGLEAWYEIFQSTADDFSTDIMSAQGSLGTIVLATSYPVSISYDGDNTFTFEFNGTSVDVDGPSRAGDPYNDSKLVGTRARFGQNNSTADDLTDSSPENGSVASITGTVDNVTTGSGLVDSFSGASIDQAIWNKGEFSKIVEDEQLKLVAKSINTDRARTSFWIINQDVNFLGAKVTLSSDSTQTTGAQNRARMTGYWYNDTYDENEVGNGREGNIWVRSSIRRKSDGTVVCVTSAERADDADHDTWTDIINYEETSCQLDTEYELSIEKTATSLIISRDGEVVRTHTITTPMYPAKGETEKRLRAETRDAAAETHALFDDITTDYIAATVTLNAKNSSDEDIEFPETVIVHEDEVVTLTAEVGDPSNVAAYLWEQLSGPDVAARGVIANKVVGSDSTYSFTVPAGSDTETLAFKVTVVDNAGVDSAQQFDMSVDNSANATLQTVNDPDDDDDDSGGSSGVFNPVLLFLVWIGFLGISARRRLK